VATRQASYADGVGIATEVPPSFAPDGVLFVTTEYDGIWLLGPDGTRRRALTPPDSIRVAGFAANPAGDSVAVVAYAEDRARLAVSPLDRWEPRWLHDLAAGEFSTYLNWNRSGLLHFWLWPSGETAPGLWRVAVAGGAARRSITLTTACNTGHVDIAVGAERGVCRGEDIRSDMAHGPRPGHPMSAVPTRLAEARCGRPASLRPRRCRGARALPPRRRRLGEPDEACR
jgi:hypothetical protein